MTLQILKQDGRRRGLNADWEEWLNAADRLHQKFRDELDFSPFELHEVGCVGFLASAAAVAGFVSISEYDIDKNKGSEVEDIRPGRADLWISANHHYYSFECKRAYHSATPKNLKDVLELAVRDTKQIPFDENKYAAALMTAFNRDPERMNIYLDFAQSSAVDSAYYIGPAEQGGGFLFFKIVEKKQ
jgi:hypothetical protein